MSPLTTGVVGIVALFVLIFGGMPIALAMSLVGFVGYGCISGWADALWRLQSVPFTTFSTSYAMTCIPLFILMGELCFHAGISQELYKTVHAWLGRLRGGLAMATVGACASFAAVSGSSVASAATMGTVALPEMKRYKYDSALATGSIAAGGSIGILIPPSVVLIVYGLIADQSIGRLFLAGFIPGILEAIFYMGVIYLLCLRNPQLGPPGPATSFCQKIKVLRNTWPVLILFGLVMGGIYFGVFTPTEAGGIGAFGAFVFAVARRKLTLRVFGASLISTAKTTAFILLIIMGANILGFFLTLTKLPNELAGFISGFEVNRYIIMAGIMVMYVGLGCVMEGLSIILLTVPILLPLLHGMGFDPIWYGIIIVRVVEIGLITPPLGINVFIIKGVAKDVPMYTIFRGIVPFLMADMCHVALLVAVPQLALFLPNLMK